MTKQKQKIVVIVGPTAVGKTTLAIELARRFRGEVVSADSRQIYRGLDIGTGKVMRREMRGVRHHLLDVASARRQWNVAQYVQHAERAIARIAHRGMLPVVVGGTGFYIDALLGIIPFSDVLPNAALRRALARHSPPELLEELRRLYPARAKTIDPHNSRRLIRAIEIARAHGKVPHNQPCQKYDALLIGLRLHDNELREHINVRLKTCIKRGLIAEVRRLHEKNNISWRRLDALGLEYRYVSRFLSQNTPRTRAELERMLEQKIWQYARRQKTWLRRYKNIHWFRPDEIDTITRALKTFLRL